MVGVHAEPETGHESYRDLIESGHGGEARHVLLRCAQPVLVAAHQDVGPAVHQHDGVHAAQVLQQGPVGVPEGPDAGEREGVHRVGQVLEGEPAGESPFGEVVAADGGVRAYRRDVVVHPHVEVQPVQIREGQVGQVDLLAGRPQREGQRHTGVHVETAARAGDENPARVTQPGEEGGLQ